MVIGALVVTVVVEDDNGVTQLFGKKVSILQVFLCVYVKFPNFYTAQKHHKNVKVSYIHAYLTHWYLVALTAAMKQLEMHKVAMETDLQQKTEVEVDILKSVLWSL